MTDSKYIYGVIEAKERCEFGSIGLGEKPVYTIGLHGLACVVSDSDLEVYIANSVNLAEHERVLEKVMSEHVVLPMRFGTVAGSEREILLTIKKHGNQFLRMLKKLEGKVEVELEIAWKDMKAVFSDIALKNPVLKKLKSNENARSREEIIMAGQMVYQLLQDKKRKESELFIKTLKRVSEGCAMSKDTRDELMMNASFLIDKKKIGEFDKALGSLDTKSGGLYDIKYIGPLPPYSFVEMRVK